MLNVAEVHRSPPIWAVGLSFLLASACVPNSGVSAEGSGGSDDGDALMGELAIQCDAYCRKEVGLACANGASVEDCNLDCVGLGEMYPSCEPQWNAHNQCMTAANMICDEDGYPAVGEECFDQLDAYGQCLGSQ